jgi:hypothetical protein
VHALVYVSICPRPRLVVCGRLVARHLHILVLRWAHGRDACAEAYEGHNAPYELYAAKRAPDTSPTSMYPFN